MRFSGIYSIRLQSFSLSRLWPRYCIICLRYLSITGTMTAKQLVRARIAGILIVVVTIILGIASILLIPKIVNNSSVAYTNNSFFPEAKSYCPGEVLTFKYGLQRRRTGPIEITSSWCRIDNICSLTDSRVDRAIVFNSSERITATLSITIPHATRMLPGSEWVFVRSIQNVGDDKYDMFTVPFRIKDVCP